MSTKRKLFRVDVRLKYLMLTENENYGSQADILKWLKDIHDGELDADENDGEAIIVKEVTDRAQIPDFGDIYCPYNEGDDETVHLEQIVDELHLDAPKLIARLSKLGYTVLPPLKAPLQRVAPVSKAKPTAKKKAKKAK